MSIKNGLFQVVKAVLPPSVALRLRQARALRLVGQDVELEMLPIFARGGAFIDIGANIGLWSKFAARYFPAVHAFEPDSLLSRTLPKILPGNVTVHPFALSDHEGTSELITPVIDGAPASGRASLESSANLGLDSAAQTVSLRTLDSFGLRNVDAIKIDVEGHEGGVLAGARGLLASEKPIVICEIEERHHPGASETIIADVCAGGYSCYIIRRGRLESFAAGMIDDLQRVSPTVGYAKNQDYINNFVFIPSEARAIHEPAIRKWLEENAVRLAG